MKKRKKIRHVFARPKNFHASILKKTGFVPPDPDRIDSYARKQFQSEG